MQTSNSRSPRAPPRSSRCRARCYFRELFGKVLPEQSRRPPRSPPLCTLPSAFAFFRSFSGCFLLLRGRSREEEVPRAEISKPIWVKGRREEEEGEEGGGDLEKEELASKRERERPPNFAKKGGGGGRGVASGIQMRRRRRRWGKLCDVMSLPPSLSSPFSVLLFPSYRHPPKPLCKFALFARPFFLSSV